MSLKYLFPSVSRELQSIVYIEGAGKGMASLSIAIYVTFDELQSFFPFA
jgi:hypothetical protein